MLIENEHFTIQNDFSSKLLCVTRNDNEKENFDSPHRKGAARKQISIKGGPSP